MTLPARTSASIEPKLVGHSGYLARLAAFRAEALLGEQLPPQRSMRDVAVLCVLEGSRLSQADLGTMLSINRTVMISVIDALEADDLVQRERDPADRRCYALAIRADGLRELATLRRAVDSVEATLLAGLGPRERRRLIELLRQVQPTPASDLPTELTNQACFLLGPAAQFLRARSVQTLREHGLAPRCVRLLLALEADQPCTQEQLARSLTLAAPSIVGDLDELHGNDLILRERNPADRRAYVLRLSPSGQRYLADALAAEHAGQRTLEHELGRAEVHELNSLLTEIASGRPLL
ncbi:MarR family winged helix-turn-helix transcriptional regulator [Amycolatopsis anabasis]|uniref:MarR family winged helix-turn-helix transcriptional regulator n=1 Tax=Amycolatopsis anabasis TaxID=1840409 RepID=UPI00131C42EC|nr:MarR family winged helix-turn-helix transcriptional regulator [Amycolatopsis anabasis]